MSGIRVGAEGHETRNVQMSDSDIAQRQDMGSTPLFRWSHHPQRIRRPKLPSPITPHKPLVTRRKRPQLLPQSVDEPALKRQYRYTGDSQSKPKSQNNGQGFNETSACSDSPPRIVGASPRRGRPSKRGRGRHPYKKKEVPAVYSRHYQPLVHSGASSSLRTAMMGSLELEKEMKHKPVSCNGVTAKDMLGGRNVSKLQLPVETKGLQQSPVRPGFFTVSGNFTYYDGKVFTQVEKKSVENTSGSPTQQKWLKLGPTGSEQTVNATHEPGPLAVTETTVSSNTAIAVINGQSRSTTPSSSQPPSRTPESYSTTPTVGQSAPVAEHSDPMPTDSTPKSSSDTKTDIIHHRTSSLSIISKPAEWTIQNRPDHEYAAVPRGIRLKIKRENITSPVWVSESISADIGPGENQGTSQETQENNTSHKHNRSKSYSSKWSRDHEMKPAKNNRQDSTQSDIGTTKVHGKVKPMEEKKSPRNHCEDNALVETPNTKQEQKSGNRSNQTDKGKPSTSQLDKQASFPKPRRSADLFYAPRPSNKRSQLVDQDSPLFNIYEIVWAKMVDRPWWPARVLSFGQSYGSGAPKTMESASVKWLGRPTTCASSLPSSLLMSFVDGFVQNYDRTSTKTTYVRAIREALEIFGFNPDDPVAFYDYCKKLSEAPSNTTAELTDNADTTTQQSTPATACTEQT